MKRAFGFAVAALLSATAVAEDKQLTLLVTGDVRGEVAPCG